MTGRLRAAGTPSCLRGRSQQPLRPSVIREATWRHAALLRESGVADAQEVLRQRAQLDVRLTQVLSLLPWRQEKRAARLHTRRQLPGECQHSLTPTSSDSRRACGYFNQEPAMGHPSTLRSPVGIRTRSRRLPENRPAPQCEERSPSRPSSWRWAQVLQCPRLGVQARDLAVGAGEQLADRLQGVGREGDVVLVAGLPGGLREPLAEHLASRRRDCMECSIWADHAPAGRTPHETPGARKVKAMSGASHVQFASH